MTTRNHPPPPDSQPTDLVGTDHTGRVRIDRVIPLQWVLGVIAAGVVNAAAMYYGQQQLIAGLAELKAEVRTLTQTSTTGQLLDREHTLQIADHERRLTNLEKAK